MIFSKKLIAWYLQNKREMPWRQTKEPYRIWLSEIILQQTRVAQGEPYYLTFVDTFPTIFDLANATEESVLKLWQGLGYYSRARNLHAAAKYVAYECNGVFPKSFASLLALKGVGEYTASAIASICYGEAVPVIDGNVYRVLSRYFGIDTPINSTEGIKTFKKLAIELMDHDAPSDYNQAIMEFGALQCKPKSPYCIVCPLNDSCEALRLGTVPQLPVKLKKTKVKKRYFNYLIFTINDQETIVQQRTSKGIWQHLYEFPLVESDRDLTLEEIIASPLFLTMTQHQEHTIIPHQEAVVIHKLSHQHLHTRFYTIVMDSHPTVNEAQQLKTIDQLRQLPVPILLGKFIETFF